METIWFDCKRNSGEQGSRHPTAQPQICKPAASTPSQQLNHQSRLQGRQSQECERFKTETAPNRGLRCCSKTDLSLQALAWRTNNQCSESTSARHSTQARIRPHKSRTSRHLPPHTNNDIHTHSAYFISAEICTDEAHAGLQVGDLPHPCCAVVQVSHGGQIKLS